jgi:hypothetical protein
MVSMRSRKVYCGRLLEIEAVGRADRRHVEILPAFSAARDKDTLELLQPVLSYPIYGYWLNRSRRTAIETLIALADPEKEMQFSLDQLRSEIDLLDSELQADLEGSLSHLANSNYRDWIKVINLDDIESATIFDQAAFEIFFRVLEPSEPSSLG